MKKFVSLIIVLALLATMALSLTACDAKHPIEKFKSKMIKDNSYQMDFSVFSSFLGDTAITLTTETDGKIHHVPASVLTAGIEIYVETDKDEINYYTKGLDGRWVKTALTEAQMAELDFFANTELILTLFDSKNYKKDKDNKNLYVQKKEAHFDLFTEVTILIEDDTCTMEMLTIEDGTSIQIVVSRIGEVDLTLPTVN